MGLLAYCELFVRIWLYVTVIPQINFRTQIKAKKINHLKLISADKKSDLFAPTPFKLSSIAPKI